MNDMEKIFSKDRMLLLTRSIFIQNRSKDLRLALVIAGIMAFFGLVSPSYGDYDLFGVVNVCVLLVLAGTTYKMLAVPSRAMEYLMLPASTAEKTVVTIAYLDIYYVLLLMASSYVGFYFGQMLQNLIAIIPFFRDLFGSSGHDFALSAVSFKELGDNLLLLIAAMSVLMFGSLYFRRHAILKTLLVFCGFCFALFILDMAVIAGVGSAFELSIRNVNLPDLPKWAETMIEIMVPCLFTLFFWFMTYLRLRETEA